MNQRRFRNAALALILGFGFGTAIIAANDLRQRNTGEPLGELDFFRYCVDAYEPAASAVLNSNDANGWRCMVLEPIFELVEIDVDQACTAIYDTTAQARTADASSPYEWKCYRV